MTLDQAVRALAARIAKRPHADGSREARALMAHVTGLDAGAQLARSNEALSEAHWTMLNQLAARREAGEPLARLMGRAPFWDFEVGLNAATLVPRDDTGTLVEAALAMLPADSTAHVVDIGTGSGIILLALARERPHITGTGLDKAPDAIAKARANAETLGVADRLAFKVSDWLDGVNRPVDMIVSNPPYISAADMDRLEDEVRDHDPRLALVAGEDGLDAYRAILPQAMSRLRPGGHLLLEIGHEQAKAVTRMGEATGFAPLGTRQDLSGHDRVVGFQR